MTAAAKAIGASRSEIYRACRVGSQTCGGYVYRYADKDQPEDKEPLNNIPKPVSQYNPDGSFVRTWPSLAAAGNALGVSYGVIRELCKGEPKIYRGCVFRFADDPPPSGPPKSNRERPVSQYHMDGSFVRTFSSAKAAADAVGVSGSTIRQVCRGKCKTSRGYVFRYAEDPPPDGPVQRWKRS